MGPWRSFSSWFVVGSIVGSRFRCWVTRTEELLWLAFSELMMLLTIVMGEFSRSLGLTQSMAK